jgi:DNA-binding MurR/RpiR family transcriptional regulator
MINTPLVSRASLCNVCVMSRSPAERITAVLPQLPRAERKVARLILSDHPMAAVQSVAQVAEQAGVSGPTVLRLAKRLGYEGFPELREALWHEMYARVASPLSLYPQIGPDPLEHAITRADAVFSQTAPQLEAAIDRDQFDWVVGALADERRRVFTAGGRFSRLAAENLAVHLEVLRPGVRHVRTSDYVQTILDARRGDILVVFDVRRYQQDVIDLAESAAGAGMTLVVVTDPWISPAAASARALLTMPVATLGPFDSLIPAAIMAETLVAGVVEELGERPKERIERYDVLWGERGLRGLAPDDES